MAVVPARSMRKIAAMMLLVVMPAAVVQGVNIQIVNHCNGTMKLFDGANVTRIKEGKSVSLELKPKDIRAYRYDAITQATLAEFSIDEGNKTWYDISVIPTGPLSGPQHCASLGECKTMTGGVGFNKPMQINPKVDYVDANCRKLVCLEDGCEDAYQFPQQDEKTHCCAAGVDFQVVFCPTTEDTEQDWIDVDAGLEKGVVVGDTTPAPTQAPETTAPDSEVTTRAVPEDDSSAAVYVASVLGGTVLVVVAAAVVLRYRQRVVANVQYHWPDRKSSDAMSFVSARDAGVTAISSIKPSSMGHAHSHDAFAVVLPADKATKSSKKGSSAAAAAVTTTTTNAPRPKSLAANEEQRGNGPTPVSKEPPNDSTMRIQPPAHALLLLLLQDDSRLSSARSSSGDVVNEGVVAHRDHCELEHGDTSDNRFLVPESVRKSRVLDEFADVCSEILSDFLFVSNLQVARSAQRLKELGITHVVNCCKEPGPCHPLTADGDLSGTKVLSLALRDDTKEDLLWFFYQAIEFLQSAEAAETDSNKVFVHCHQGISRSCALVVAYVMYQRQQQQSPPSFRDALAFVKAKRPIASPNTAFLCQLIEWERELATFSSTTSSLHPEAAGLYRLAPHAAHDPDTLVLKCRYKPGSQRQKLVAAEGGSYSPWLFTRGVFVFMRPSTSSVSQSRVIAIWRGRKCEIPDGVALAKALVGQMVRVRLGQRRRAEGQNGEWAHLAIEIVEVREEDQEIGGGGGSLIDHFGYAEELDWLKIRNGGAISTVYPNNNNSTIPNSSNLTNIQELETVTTETDAGATITAGSIPTISKPLLFVLEDGNEVEEGVWDQLTEYDSEDLTPGDAFLLVQPSKLHYFLWIGPEHSTFAPETLVNCAQTHVRSLLCSSADTGNTTGTPGIKIEKGGEKSDKFWTAFESGY